MLKTKISFPKGNILRTNQIKGYRLLPMDIELYDLILSRCYFEILLSNMLKK